MGHGGPIRNRPTSELVILLLAVVIGLAVLLVPPAVLIVDIFRPSLDTRETVDSYVNVVSVLVGAVVGYVSARRTQEDDDAEDRRRGDTPPPV